MYSVTDRQTDDRMMPIVDHTVLQCDRLKTVKTFETEKNYKKLFFAKKLVFFF